MASATSRSTTPLICIVGSLNIDFVTSTPRVPGPGETLTATSLTINAGGKGANQAVACGRASYVSASEQDIDVELVGAVGKDDIYVRSLLLPLLKNSGVGTKGIKEIDAAQTGTASIILEAANGENRIMVVGGANIRGMTDEQEVRTRVRAVGNGRNPDIIVLQGEIPRSTTLALLEAFKGKDAMRGEAKSTTVLFNPAPVFPEGIPETSLYELDILVVNQGEALLLAKSLCVKGFEEHDMLKEENLENLDTLSKLVKHFHTQLRIKTVIVTLGARGAFYSDNDSSQNGLVPAAKVEQVRDTTAAGDTFVGYLAAALARHLARGCEGTFDLAAAIAGANEASAKCVQRPGAMQSIPFGYE